MLIKNVPEIEVDDLPEHISIDKLHFKKKNNVYVPTVEYTSKTGEKAEFELTLYSENIRHSKKADDTAIEFSFRRFEEDIKEKVNSITMNLYNPIYVL